MPASKDKKPESSSASRHVNNLLHTLRGEQFRHAQNLQGSKAHLKRLYSHSYNNPTLPFDQIYDTVQSNPEHVVRRDAPPSIMRVGPQGILEYAYPNGEVPGPGPPRSWGALFGKGKGKEADEAACRADALSLIFSHQPEGIGSSWAHRTVQGHLPSAAHAAMPARTLRILHWPAFAEELVPCLPSHLRRNLLRWTAVHSPLPTSKLYALCAPDGHVDGELIVVGPQASLHRDFLKADTACTGLASEPTFLQTGTTI
ncbi:hypothetical protein B0H21DRAFT_849941 [Amylocystis lapponica]|nr:hypothetical protein B0H21DRAFT_849941 [Amylocystis lapponica]